MMRGRAAAQLVALALAAFALVACRGGDVTPFRLEKDAASLASLAADGSLLASATARGETTSAYARVHAEELRAEATKLAAVLESATPEAHLGARTRRLTRLAREAAGSLERLEKHASNDAVADAAAARLAAIANAADEIRASA